MRHVLEDLERRRAEAEAGGGPRRIAAQHAKGKLTARERIDLLLDEGSFEEFDMYVEHRSIDFGMEKNKIPGDGVVTGWGTVNGRAVFVFSKDFTVFGGSLCETHAGKITKVQDMALRMRAPIIGLFDAGGARIQEGVAALGGYGEVFRRNVEASGVIPQISVIMGPCAGGDVYSPAMTDFIVMVRDTSYMFVTGPDVVKTVTNETVTAEELGGARVHTTNLDRRHRFDNDLEALLQVRRLVDFLPPTTPGRARLAELRRCRAGGASLDTLVPENANKPYDIKEAILKIVDEGDFFEIQGAFARTSSPVLRGSTAAPSALWRTSHGAGRRARLRCLAQGRALRAVLRRLRHPDPHLRRRARLSARDRAGAGRPIKHGAKLLFAYSQCTVPLVTVITRKAFGGAYDVMASKHVGATSTMPGRRHRSP